MFKILFLLFLIVPIIEIFLLIEVGNRIGAFNTVGLILLTAMAGTFLLRQQGLSTLARVQQQTNQGQLPAQELIEGLMLLVCGALLLTPGFFTDTIGFLCLIPSIRMQVASHLLQTLFQSLQEKHRRGDPDNITIEGEFWQDNDQSNRDKDRLP